ncbi:ABC transporter ATP-binding protein [Luteolibacter pohnpeiensis]|uniref:ABC transporter ATP-binding protein n=1 Tax=Luteolibacter pohnpeiensis TaxID=454153 RepID=A0A934S4M5_9BACT|nr:ABC transporter ATP-binding protein [Luteolibacter pohnpeiensis]MBK1881145.1 ABC transporter ATP-binding protein [Luteolibacter pohnpeiensis]
MITIRGLQKRFHGKDALRGVDLDIPEGKVTAFLGPNGAGKSTTIKCAMNLIDRDAGKIQILGSDARDLGPEQWRRIGYVSENRRLPEWLTVPKLLDFIRPMYGDFWDRDFEKKLLKDLEIPLKTKLQNMSRGQKMKAALLAALPYRPQLIVLDEPFTGLDPLVRDEFLTGLLELTETEGWTVWISSHDIEEVERFADRIAVLENGRIDLQEDVETLQSRFRHVELWFDEAVELPANLPETWINLQAAGRTIRYVDIQSNGPESSTASVQLFPSSVRQEIRPMTLREIFVALARSYRIKTH